MILQSNNIPTLAQSVRVGDLVCVPVEAELPGGFIQGDKLRVTSVNSVNVTFLVESACAPPRQGNHYDVATYIVVGLINRGALLVAQHKHATLQILTTAVNDEETVRAISMQATDTENIGNVVRVTR